VTQGPQALCHNSCVTQDDVREVLNALATGAIDGREAEDRLMDRWEQAVSGIQLPEFSREPGFSAAYSGPGGKARKSGWTG